MKKQIEEMTKDFENIDVYDSEECESCKVYDYGTCDDGCFSKKCAEYFYNLGYRKKFGDKIYIDDFCDDLNYSGVILYISESVNIEHLRKTLEKSYINHMHRFDYAIRCEDPAMKNFIFIENCDMQELVRPIHTYIDEGYDVHTLYEEDGKFYVKDKIF